MPESQEINIKFSTGKEIKLTTKELKEFIGLNFKTLSIRQLRTLLMIDTQYEASYDE